MSQNNGIYTVAARFDADCTPTHVFVARKSATTTNYARNRIDKTFVVGVYIVIRLLISSVRRHMETDRQVSECRKLLLNPWRPTLRC